MLVFGEHCAKTTSNPKKKASTAYQKNIDTFSMFNVNKIVPLIEIYYISYYIKDNLEWENWRLKRFHDF
jgi:hypothetical protein